MTLLDSPRLQTRRPYTREDFPHSPLLVFYETTRACNLMCRHCRADAQRKRHPDELNTDQAKALIEQIATFPRTPLIVFTGGDPMKRRDIFELVNHAREVGIETAMTPSATPLVTADAIRRLKEAGLHRFAVSLDGADVETHDGFRRVPGSFARTMQIVRDARAVDLPVQINTTIARHNFSQIDAIAELLSGMDILMWSVFFLVPTGRALADQRLTAEENEYIFGKLYAHSRRQPYAIKTTEAPHYRRFVMQQQAREVAAKEGNGDATGFPPHSHRHRASPLSHGSLSDNSPSAHIPLVGTNDGRGVMFVSHIGEIFPSGFLPIECGRFPLDSVVRTYQDAVLFRALRDASQFKGKCGVCHYHDFCGGSRARSYAVTGDPLAAEPDCSYIPAAFRAQSGEVNPQRRALQVIS